MEKKNAEGIHDAAALRVPGMLVLGVQHLFAMFGATVLVPALTGLSVSATLLFAGTGTLVFHLVTGGKVPAFLGSSFAFLGGYAAVAPMLTDGATGAQLPNAEMLPYACAGVAATGGVYLAMAFLFRLFGAGKVMGFFPPIVTGPIIICIGLSLAGSAIGNCRENWPVALAAIGVVAVCNIWGRGMVKIIPILLGVAASYGLAMILDPAAREHVARQVAQERWLGLPIVWENTALSVFGTDFDGGRLLTAVFAVALSFCPRFAALIVAMPAATMGGVSLVLYGMISAVGVRNLVENRVDFTKSRNVLIAAMIMGLAVGISYNGAITVALGSVSVSLSGLAIAALVGIALNAVLPGRDYEFSSE